MVCLWLDRNEQNNDPADRGIVEPLFGGKEKGMGHMAQTQGMALGRNWRLGPVSWTNA